MKTVIILLLSLLVNSGEFNSNCTGRLKKEALTMDNKNITAMMFLKSLFDDLTKIEMTTTVTTKKQKCKCSRDELTTKANLNNSKYSYNTKDIEALTEKNNNVSLNIFCPYYKEVLSPDIDKMVDEWKLTYYKASDELHCFKIIISKTTSHELDHYEKKFSNFDSTIAWKQCYLELAPSGTSKNNRKHFLQATNSSKSVFNNVIITYKHENDNDSTIVTLNEQNPDQWYVTDFLLIMRDCDNGDVLIFTRVPACQNKGTCLLSDREQPDKSYIDDTMISFGEDGMNETEKCEDVYPENDFNYVRVKYDSFSE